MLARRSYGIYSFIILTFAVTLLADDAFFSASRQGQIDILQDMLNQGFDVTSVDAKGNSAVIIASGRGRVEVLKLLFAHNANVESYTLQGLFQGKTALMWACSQGIFQYAFESLSVHYFLFISQEDLRRFVC